MPTTIYDDILNNSDLSAIQMSALQGGFSYVSTTTISNVASVDFGPISQAYTYLFILDGITPATDNTILTSRFHSGGTYVSSAGAYGWLYTGATLAGTTVTVANAGNDSATAMNLAPALGTASVYESLSGFLILQNLDGATGVTMMGKLFGDNATPDQRSVEFYGQFRASASATGVQFYQSTGDLASGRIYTSRMKKS